MLSRELLTALQKVPSSTRQGLALALREELQQCIPTLIQVADEVQTRRVQGRAQLLLELIAALDAPSE